MAGFFLFNIVFILSDPILGLVQNFDLWALFFGPIFGLPILDFLSFYLILFILTTSNIIIWEYIWDMNFEAPFWILRFQTFLSS